MLQTDPCEEQIILFLGVFRTEIPYLHIICIIPAFLQYDAEVDELLADFEDDMMVSTYNPYDQEQLGKGSKDVRKTRGAPTDEKLRGFLVN